MKIKNLKLYLIIMLAIFSVINIFLYIEIAIHPTAYQFLIPLILLDVVIYFLLIKYLLILVAVPIYQNEQISSQIFETPIKITESSQKITVFLCIQIVFLIQIGPLKLISGFVKLINNSTKKEYSLNLYTAGKVMRNITTLTKAYTIIIRSFTDIPAGDYTLSIDTGSKNMPIETLKVIEK